MAQNFPYGALHHELGSALNEGMRKLRGRILTYVETLGLPPSQEDAFKSLVKDETSSFWSGYEKLLATKLVEITQEKKEQV